MQELRKDSSIWSFIVCSREIFVCSARIEREKQREREREREGFRKRDGEKEKVRES